jgi:flagellar protein FlbD
MITLSRLNQTPVVINVTHIVTISSTPDTLITLFSGEKILVRESPHEIIEKTKVFLQQTSSSHCTHMPFSHTTEK